MISERYKLDNNHSVYLNKKRIKIRNIVQENLNSGKYINETVKCYICDSESENHELISTKERHGLELHCVICQKCGLIFTNPRMDKNSYGDFYTKYYRDLYNYYIGKNDLEFLHESNYANGINVFKIVEPFIKSESNILEIGCANGGLIKYFRERGHNVTGLDLGEAEVKYGKERFGLNLIHKSIDDYQSDKKQDLIIMIHVIEHLTEPEITMKQIHENLSDDGLLFVSCPDVDTLSTGEIYKSDWLTLMQNAHTINFDKASISNLLGKYGFEIIYFEAGMNLLARKNNKMSFKIENNYNNATKNIVTAENNFQSRAVQNRIRKFLEVKGIFAFLIFIIKPINKILIKLGIQKYVKVFLKFLYRYI